MAALVVVTAAFVVAVAGEADLSKSSEEAPNASDTYASSRYVSARPRLAACGLRCCTGRSVTIVLTE